MVEKTIHEGRNIKRLREILGIKQDDLAIQLGLSQQAISQLEQKEKVDSKILEDVAKALKIPVEAIRSFSDEATFNIVSNSFHDFKDNAHASLLNYHCSFNPLDKLMEQVEENKKLYEALLKSEREKITLLEKMLEKK